MAKGDGGGEGEHEHGKANIRKTTAAQQAREVVGQSVESTQEKRNGIGAPVAWPLVEARPGVFIRRAKSIRDRHSTRRC